MAVDSKTQSLITTAIGTRCFTLLLGLLAGYCFPHYDRSGRSPLAQWDSIFYLDIAQHSYRFEKQFAFQPLLPLCIRWLSEALKLLVDIDEWYLNVICGVLISNVCFVLAALGLYRLGQTVLSNEQVAYQSAICFCFTPTGIFMSAVYTESLFACCSFWGLYLLFRDQSFFAAICIALAVATRTNGAVLIGYLGYRALKKTVQSGFRLRSLLFIWTKTILLIAVALLPLMMFFAFGYRMFCLSQNRPYCTDRIPNIYSFVQAEYWGLGAFNYYTVKQIPNFLLSAPVVLLTFALCLSFIQNEGAKQLMSAGLLKSKLQPTTGGIYSSNVTSFVYHAVVLLMFMALVGHVQVLTRLMLSSCPILYWFVAQESLRSSRVSLLYLVWSAIYTCVGTCLYATFLPWT